MGTAASNAPPPPYPKGEPFLPDDEFEEKTFKKIRVQMFLLSSLITIPLAVVVFLNVTEEDATKPCDEPAYLDKAFLYNSRYLDRYNYLLRQWILGEDTITGNTPPFKAANRLRALANEQYEYQNELSGSGNMNYRNELAENRALFAHYQDKSYSTVVTAIQEYLQSKSIDRTIALERFLADYIEYPTDDAQRKLNTTMVQMDADVVEFKSNRISKEFHKELDEHWLKLKQRTTPGISTKCLTADFDSEQLFSEYKMAVRYRSVYCVPEGEKTMSTSDKAVLVICGAVILDLIAWKLFMLGLKYLGGIY
ncbi:hypothetical protein QR680_003629 [Steinernema hermaphroditum]|uniref:Uncharacterized protein n=1 Tax=Steinernema hermaphroditum TaxID=289476 RepID=A0AA39HL07_9BILA|nr:hypothetical protein QR680_003629 [Steinernema hermaphroditum]